MDQICKLVACLELMEEIDFTFFGQRLKPSPPPSSSLAANMSRRRWLRQAMLRPNFMLVHQNFCRKMKFNKEIERRPGGSELVVCGRLVGSVPEYFTILLIFLSKIETKYFTGKTFTS